MSTKSNGSSKKTATAKKSSKAPIPIDSVVSSSEIKTGSTPNAEAAMEAQDMTGVEDRIRVRAYELYIERGCLNGFHEQDWAQAETEVLAKRSARSSGEGRGKKKTEKSA